METPLFYSPVTEPVKPEPSPPQFIPMAVPPPAVPDAPATASPQNVPIVIYDIMSGKVLANQSVSLDTLEGHIERRNTPLLFAEEKNSRLEYVVMGEVVPRPENPAILEGLILSNIPTDSFEPAKIEITSQFVTQSYDIAGLDNVTLDFPNPGQYVIELSCFPYKTAHFVVNT